MTINEIRKRGLIDGADAARKGWKNSDPAVPTIKIHVSGGIVSHVESTGPANVEIYDFDNLKDGEAEDECSPTVHSFGDGGEEL